MKLKNRIWHFLVSGNILQLVIFHIVLGLIGIFTPYALILWFYISLIQFFLLNRTEKQVVLPYLLIYLIPIELFGRMLGASPLIPTEIGKYLGILLLIYGMSTSKFSGRGGVGWLLILLSVPGLLLVIGSKSNWFQDVVFNYLGLINLALAVVYFSNKNIHRSHVGPILRLFVAGSISILAYSFFEAPNLSDINFELTANTDLTAGYGSNQVSTILGAGFAVAFFIWLLRLKLFSSNLVNLMIPVVFLGWSVLTFSRGGVVAAIISVAVIVLFTPKGKTVYTPRRLKGFTIIIIFVLIPGLFYVTDQYTGGILVKRYQGATYATEMGFKDQSINTLTTNRWNLAVSDIQIWQDHFVFGVGAGQSTFKRTDYGLERIAPHSELTRFLAEHGIFGLFIALIFVLFPLLKYIRARTPLQKAMVAFCFILAIASSFHSAMRTFITPFFYGFACANFISSTPQTKRKEELKNEELQPLSE